MRKCVIISFIILMLTCNLLYAKQIKMPELIAHAGGGINNTIYTNSREALDYNYSKGFRFFELDFDWTEDGELVLIHYWVNDTLKRLFNVEVRVYYLKEFKSFKMINNMTQMALGDLINWMKKQLNKLKFMELTLE